MATFTHTLCYRGKWHSHSRKRAARHLGTPTIEFHRVIVFFRKLTAGKELPKHVKTVILDQVSFENPPADEYNEDDDTELLSVSASNNTLSLVYRDPGTMRFVKYVSSSAPSSRYDICMEYQLPPDDDNDNDNDDGDNTE